jgi:hemolysin activation/secretion protein
VERFEFSYGLDHPELPALPELDNLTFKATRDGNVLRAPATLGAENLALSAIPEGSRFDSDALRGIAQEVVRWYNDRGIYGVWVTYSDLESSTSGVVDNRPADIHTARMVIWASQIAEVRTLARGKRFKPQASVNNRKHRGIAQHSPLQPGKTPDQPGSLFRQGELTEYIHGLSLHPGRLVEASIASAGDPGKVVLDYLVNESKSWQLFGQINNYGTEATGKWRGRVGFQHNQLTNHDDILNVDAITTPDFETYGSFLSYRFPIFRPALLLARVYGSYGDYLATDAALQDLRFAGNNWMAGSEFINRLTLPRNWQLVTNLGANYPHYEVESRINETPLISGYSEFLIPFLGTTLSREGQGWAVSGNVRLDLTVGDFANLNTDDGISTLGRIAPDSEWTSVRWNVSGSIYLERLFQGSEPPKHLANELLLRTRGRVLLRGERLIPQEQEPIGGALSVRGYPESILSADEFALASVEYLFHIPRILKPGEPGRLFGRDFSWRPEKLREEPDWDLVFRAFYDYAYRQVASPLTTVGQPEGEVIALVDSTLGLSGTGVGMEMVVKQNFSLRFDVGMALTELRDYSRPADQQIVVPAGSIQYYVSSSFSW